ncbi:MAG: NAD+ synthase [Candidatus Krumholzibacteriia bacterium]|jgi:NAD+ synthase
MTWIEPTEALVQSAQFVRESMQAASREKIVVGMSGGIDSAVAAGVAVHALGADKVHGIMMPYRTSSAASLVDARAVADSLGISIEEIEITGMTDSFIAAIDNPDRMRQGNIMARCRMIVLYDRSAQDDALVLGTGNRTESLLGYTTMYGDNACAFNPIGQLYKTEIRTLAAHLNLPEAVISKAPSADLWEGQSDEDELGLTYAEADRLLVAMFDEGLASRQLQALGFATDLINRIQHRVGVMAFKRNLPPVCSFLGRAEPSQPVNEFSQEAGKDGGFH